MITRSIGRLTVTVAGLGCNAFGSRIDEPSAAAVVRAALEEGINHFDTAEAYGDGKSEEFLGRALGRQRKDVVITTKFGSRSKTPPGGLRPGSPEWVAYACEQSLRRLGTDYIDLYLLHHPDPHTPIGDTLEALNQLVTAGKVREIGCSNFSAQQLREAASAAEERGVRNFAAVQNSYSLLDRTAELEVIPACQRLGVSFVPYFPLAAGMLTGKYRRGAAAPDSSRLAVAGQNFPDLGTDECFDVIEALDKFACSRGHMLHELALSWLASDPAVSSVIAGAVKAEQVRANAAATIAWDLSDDDRFAVNALTDVARSFMTSILLLRTMGTREERRG